MKVHLIFGDDWAGMYIDGTLVTEGHSLRPTEVLEIIAKRRQPVLELDWDYLEGEALDKLHDVGRLPERLKEALKWMRSRGT